jgi:hypothetical protein
MNEYDRLKTQKLEISLKQTKPVRVIIELLEEMLGTDGLGFFKCGMPAHYRKRLTEGLEGLKKYVEEELK